MSEEDGIRRTLAQYCQYCDDGRFDDLADLFAKDAVYRVMDQTHEGREQIKAFMAKAQPPERRGKHVCGGSLIEIDVSGEQARAFTDYVFVAPADEGLNVTSVGRYHDRFVKDGDRWLFAERAIVFMGGDPPEAGGDEDHEE